MPNYQSAASSYALRRKVISFYLFSKKLKEIFKSKKQSLIRKQLVLSIIDTRKFNKNQVQKLYSCC